MDIEGIKLLAKAEALEAEARLMLLKANSYRAEANLLCCNLINDEPSVR